MLEAYGSIGIFAGIAQLLYLVTAFVLAAHLLSRATHQKGTSPELLLGLHLLLAMGFGYLLISVAVVDAQQGRSLGAGIAGALMGFGYLATILGLIATLVFNRRVFREDSGWARLFVWATATAMLVGWAGFGLVDGFPPVFEGPWLWTMMTGILAANFWVAIEPLHYHRLMRRRLRLGLAEPLVVNRFLLWGCGSMARTTMVLLGLLAPYLERNLSPVALLTATAGILIFASACGFFTSVTYWLTFFPTRRYVRWVEKRAARSAA
jgi:hypothetical protein